MTKAIRHGYGLVGREDEVLPRELGPGVGVGGVCFVTLALTWILSLMLPAIEA